MAQRVSPTDEPMREVRPVLERYAELYPPECQAKGCTGTAEKDEMFCAYHRLTDAF
jgi:hypothetical protein